MGPAARDCRCRTRWRSNQPGLSSAAKSRSMVSCTRCTGIPALHRSAIILLLWFSWPGTDMATSCLPHPRPSSFSAATHTPIVEKSSPSPIYHSDRCTGLPHNGFGKKVSHGLFGRPLRLPRDPAFVAGGGDAGTKARARPHCHGRAGREGHHHRRGIVHVFVVGGFLFVLSWLRFFRFSAF